MKKIRAAVVGVGFIGIQHCDAIKRQPNAEVAALVDADKDFVVSKGAELGISAEHCYTDYREMLDKEEIDVLHNCTPNSFHFAVNSAAMERGVCVYGEKPLAYTVEEGEKLVKMSKDKGLLNAVNFNYRGNVCALEMKGRIARGEPGRMLLVHGAYVQDWSMLETDYGWRVSEAGAGARTIADVGSHILDLTQFVTGQKITEINANTFIAHPERVNEKGVRVPVLSDDGATILAVLEDGTPLSLVVSQVSGGYKNHIALSVDCTDYSMRWQQQSADRLVIGRKKGGEETLYADSTWLEGAAKGLSTLPNGHPQGWADAQRNMIGAFYADVRAGKASTNRVYANFEDGLEIMKMVEACLKSSKTRQWVKL